ncbi:S8 family serine peptidase [Flavobacterium sp. ANB]|uniref:S8 family serine peptidase n=1 Tax=unclassified Flavobacterium TaxID=196869 RepID=UPI0012B6EC20|nr:MULTISPECIES: S8 family serine peptidase [unclassified Flavobacterium]MBF4516425.1 S8 family serine peptidase [Flavobacterium sp. ANB]MTD69678.1 S8 family serine peptidase [Flavobacterium sp. LC2016-13]
MKHYLSFFMLLFSFAMFSQTEDAWVYFNAKPNAQSFLDTPSQMLSQRALDRRTNQNIALSFTDVPLEKTFVSQIKSSTGITIKAQSKWLNALHIQGTQANLLALKSLSFVDKVVFADRNLNVTSKKVSENQVSITNDKLNTTVDYAYGTSANQIQMLNGQVLHQQNYTGAGKIIAVLDAGFPGVNTAQPFQNLIANNRILGGYDFVSRNANFYAGDDHGTMVLSTMGGYKENALIGTAPDASYYLFITEDDDSEGPVEESLWVEAAEKADSLGVDIITTSLGYFGEFTNSRYNHIYSDMNGTTNFISRGAEIAFSKGIIVVASAGNEGTQTEKHIGGPADAVSVIAVGSVTASKVRSSFSSIGPSFDGRIKPDVMARGSSATVSNASGTIIGADGTSFSCPIMAGMIACLWQAFPSKTNQQIRQMILESSDNYTTPNNTYGYGIPNFGSTLGVESFENTTSFSVYPNPAQTNVSFSFSDQNEVASVIIYSVLGQKLIEKQITNQNPILSLQSLKSGLYFYTFDVEGLHKTGKIVKQ